MRGVGGWGGVLVVHFKWIALSFVVPSPEHYNASASDLHLSSAPTSAPGRARWLLCLVQRPNVCHEPQRGRITAG